MSQFNAEIMNQDEESDGFKSERTEVRDYDEVPYGDDNILVRAMKRHAFLASTSEL